LDSGIKQTISLTITSYWQGTTHLITCRCICAQWIISLHQHSMGKMISWLSAATNNARGICLLCQYMNFTFFFFFFLKL